MAKKTYLSYGTDGETAWHRVEETASEGLKAEGRELVEVPEGQEDEMFYLHHHYRVKDGKIERKHPSEIAALEISRRPKPPEGPTEMQQMIGLMKEMRDATVAMPTQIVEKLNRG